MSVVGFDRRHPARMQCSFLSEIVKESNLSYGTTPRSILSPNIQIVAHMRIDVGTRRVTGVGWEVVVLVGYRPPGSCWGRWRCWGRGYRRTAL